MKNCRKGSCFSFWKYFFFCLVFGNLLMCACVFGDHRPRWIVVVPKIKVHTLILDNLLQVIDSDKRFKRDKYLVYGILFYRLDVKEPSAQTLWKLDCNFDNIPDNISKLPLLPNRIFYGDNINGLKVVVQPSNFSVDPHYDYRIVINVFGVNKKGEGRVSFLIKSVINSNREIYIESSSHE